MLSEAAMVRARAAIERLYDGSCTVYEKQKIKNSDGSTSFTSMAALVDIPCRLSYKSVDSISSNDDLSATSAQAVKLFLSPDVDMKPGSRVEVTQNGGTENYKFSGQPARYATHQEVSLELSKGWS